MAQKQRGFVAVVVVWNSSDVVKLNPNKLCFGWILCSVYLGVWKREKWEGENIDMRDTIFVLGHFNLGDIMEDSSQSQSQSLPSQELITGESGERTEFQSSQMGRRF